MVRVRADKQRRAALDHFTNWYVTEVTYRPGGSYRCTLRDSPMSAARERTPRSLLYFLMILLQNLVDDYWKRSAERNNYVQHCVATMQKCPPAVIGLLAYLHAPKLSPLIGLSFPSSKKHRIYDSESGRAACNSASAASASAAAGVPVPVGVAEYDAVWQQFDADVMEHLVWPAARAGRITSAPNADRDNPAWWVAEIKPLFEDERVFSIFWKGGKKRAKM